MKKIIYSLIFIIFLGFIFVGYKYYSNNTIKKDTTHYTKKKNNINQTKKKIVPKRVSKKSSKKESNTDVNDYSFEVKSNLFVLTFNDTFNYAILENRYDKNDTKKINMGGNKLNIDLSNINNKKSIYKIILYKENQGFKNIISHESNEVSLQGEFILVSDLYLYISTSEMQINKSQESNIIITYINSLREGLGLNKLNINNNINKLSYLRSKDEVEDKAYHFHFAKSSGLANKALYDNKIISNNRVTNLNGNDFEQITRGILFAWNNFNALKNSPLHYNDMIMSNASMVGAGMDYNLDTHTLNTVKIKMYGVTSDHSMADATPMYINGDFNQGIIPIEQQDIQIVNFWNVAYSIFIL